MNQKPYSIYVDGLYVCEVNAVNRILAMRQARHVPSFKEVVEPLEKKQQGYVVTACRTKGEGELVDTAALL